MRIISLAPSNTEILFALGVKDELVAVTNFCDWPPQTKAKQKIGAWINTEPEKIVALKPDLIFTSYFMPEPLRNWSGPGAVVHVAPTTLEDVYQSFRTIGQTVGRLKGAERLISQMRQEFDKIHKQPLPEKIRVYMEEWHNPAMASGNWVPELVEIAGGQEGIVKSGELSRAFDLNNLYQFNPQVIICHWCGFGERLTNDQAFNQVAGRQGWDQLEAVKRGRVAAVNDSLINRPGPRLAEGVRELEKIFKSLGNESAV